MFKIIAIQAWRGIFEIRAQLKQSQSRRQLWTAARQRLLERR